MRTFAFASAVLVSCALSRADARQPGRQGLVLTVVSAGPARVGQTVRFLLQLTNRGSAPVYFSFVPNGVWATGYGFDQGLDGMAVSNYIPNGQSEYCPEADAIFVIEPGSYLRRYAVVGPFADVREGRADVLVSATLAIWDNALKCSPSPFELKDANTSLIFRRN
jgi:hypothetical protein